MRLDVVWLSFQMAKDALGKRNSAFQTCTANLRVLNFWRYQYSSITFHQTPPQQLVIRIQLGGRNLIGQGHVGCWRVLGKQSILTRTGKLKMRKRAYHAASEWTAARHFICYRVSSLKCTTVKPIIWNKKHHVMFCICTYWTDWSTAAFNRTVFN